MPPSPPDMYVICTSFVHKVCPEGYYIALVSTTVETANPEAELAPGLKLLGAIKEKCAPHPHPHPTHPVGIGEAMPSSI